MASRYQNSPPPPPQAKLALWRVTSVEPVHFAILSSAPWGQWTHWYGSRSHECIAETHQICPRCNEGQPRKWKAFLHVMRAPEWDEGFLELTFTAMHQIEKQLPDRQTLRGLRLTIQKTKGGRYGRYVCKVDPQIEMTDSWPEEKNPIGLLRKLWSYNADRLTGKKVNNQRQVSNGEAEKVAL